MKFIINGGKKLSGEVSLSGAKNAATKMMIASILTSEPCVFENFPRIGDTEITAELCEKIGTKIQWNRDVVVLETPEVKNSKVLELSRRNRLPILALGPLLARVGEAEVPILGGDKIGPRPVNFHIRALTALGAEIEVTPTSYRAKAPNGLRGAKIDFEIPSVGATENAILGAVMAKGVTKITNAALEPEVIDLVKLLQKMGAIIELGANRDIEIEGVQNLHGASHSILPDRNEAISFACLAIGTGGRIMVRHAKQGHLINFLNVVRKMGGEYEVTKDGIIFWRDGQLKAVKVETQAHPGFMTDWQQPLVVVMTQAKGVSEIHETIYEDRFGYVNDLNEMGANIKTFTDCGNWEKCRFSDHGFMHRAVVEGGTELHGKSLVVRDLRAGMAHVLAALIATGESEISNIEELDRGYENIDERLKNLGAELKRVSG